MAVVVAPAQGQMAVLTFALAGDEQPCCGAALCLSAHPQQKEGVGGGGEGEGDRENEQERASLHLPLLA